MPPLGCQWAACCNVQVQRCRERKLLARFELLPLTSRSQTDRLTDNCKISIMMGVQNILGYLVGGYRFRDSWSLCYSWIVFSRSKVMTSGACFSVVLKIARSIYIGDSDMDFSITSINFVDHCDIFFI